MDHDSRDGVVLDQTSCLTDPARNPLQVQRFLQLTRKLSQKQLRDIQMAYENPTFGHKDIYLRLGSPSSNVDYPAFARELGIPYRRVVPADRLSYTKFGPGLEPLAEALSVVARWTPAYDLKDFITVYAPVLRSVPLEYLGFSDDWMALADPARHAPIVGAYEAVLTEKAGARALRQSLLPSTVTHVTAAICFEAALNPSRRVQLADELVELMSFVLDSDADLVAESESASHDSGGGQIAFLDPNVTAEVDKQPRAAVALSRIRDQELALMRWLGTIDEEQLKEAAADLATSSVIIGSNTTPHLVSKSDLLLNACILSIAAGLVTGIATLITLGEATSGGAWLAGLVWAWLGGCLAMLSDHWMINRVQRQLEAGGWRGGVARSAVYSVSVLVASATVAGPWILLVKRF